MCLWFLKPWNSPPPLKETELLWFVHCCESVLTTALCHINVWVLHIVKWMWDLNSTYSEVYLHQLLVYFFQRHPCRRHNGFRVYIELDLWPLTSCISLVIISFFIWCIMIDFTLLPLSIIIMPLSIITVNLILLPCPRFPFFSYSCNCFSL